MEPTKHRKLAFAKQPTDTVVGAKTKAINVIVVDENGNHDPTFDGPIKIALEDVRLSSSEKKSRPPAGVAKRLRATAAGCEDAVSNVFYVLPK